MTEQYRMDYAAMQVSREKLVETLCQRIELKKQVLRERDERYGEDRVRIGSYLENIALPDLFGYNMNDLYANPALGLEMELRHRIFWLDNSCDDLLPNLDVAASVGMYFDLTLFGQEVRHSRQGVPEFRPHPLASVPDMSTLPAEVDFHASGDMPRAIQYYHGMRDVARRWYGDAVRVGMRDFLRGPLDVYIQLRSYEGFVDDTIERPDFARKLLSYFVAQRVRWATQRRQFLGENAGEIVQVHDDWLNIPFISPVMVREFVLPAYRELERLDAPVTFFHTCGGMTPVVNDLLGAFPKITCLDISAWNNLETLNRIVAPAISFGINMVNTFTLSGTRREHREKLAAIADVRRRRQVSVTAQAIVQLHDSLDEDVRRMNQFIELARDILHD